MMIKSLKEGMNNNYVHWDTVGDNHWLSGVSYIKDDSGNPHKVQLAVKGDSTKCKVLYVLEQGRKDIEFVFYALDLIPTPNKSTKGNMYSFKNTRNKEQKKIFIIEWKE